VLATLLLTGLRSAELLTLHLGSVTGTDGERRVHVLGKGGKARCVPIENPLEGVINRYLTTRRTRFLSTRLGARSPLFVDTHGEQMPRGGLEYWASVTDALLFEAGARGHDIGRRSPHVLLRRVEGEQGHVRLRTVCAPRMEYGLTEPHLQPVPGGIRGAGGRQVLR